MERFDSYYDPHNDMYFLIQDQERQFPDIDQETLEYFVDEAEFEAQGFAGQSYAVGALEEQLQLIRTRAASVKIKEQ